MTLSEFSKEFDILYNNIMSNQAPGLSEWEKSVFLTNAQLEILKNYFNPAGNKYQQGFDDSSKRQIDFSNVIETKKLDIYVPSQTYVKIDNRSYCYDFPTDSISIVNEFLGTLAIIPINYQTYIRQMSKPYKYPLKSQAWRLLGKDTNNNSLHIVAEIISAQTNVSLDYVIRYVRRPKPIILEELSNGDTIDNLTEKTECELDQILHKEILQRAVELAKNTFYGDLKSTVDIGSRVE